MKTLYIIGNGFDLHHRMKSSLREFKAFVKSRDRTVFEDMEKYVPSKDDWSNLEVSLGCVDYQSIVDYGLNYLESYGAENWSDSYHHSMQFEVDKVCGNLSSELISLLEEWISEIEIPSKPLLKLDRAASFFSFNYTSVLEKTYKVPENQIIHPHGHIAEASSSLVLGHSWTPERKLFSNADENSDHRIEESFQRIDQYFTDSFKPAEKIIEQYSSYFALLKDVEEVYVLGHALHEVDEPYLAKITESIRKNAQFSVSYYDNRSEVEKNASIFGENVKFITMEEVSLRRN